jgi:aryl-alcohol dehydrogenase-like predicted oxidoreductase
MSIGYGTAALGRSISKRERVRLVHTAYEAGIRWFDTAPLYGAGAAEDALGIALRGKDDVTVVTKVGIVPRGVLRRRAQGGRFALADISRQLDGSLRRLQRDSLDGVLLHEVGAADAPAALDALEGDGRVRLTGIATEDTQAESILTVRVPDIVQLAAGTALDPRGARLVLHTVLAGATGNADELLRSAAAAHPGAVILVGSRRPEHIREAAAVLG